MQQSLREVTATLYYLIHMEIIVKFQLETQTVTKNQQSLLSYHEHEEKPSPRV